MPHQPTNIQTGLNTIVMCDPVDLQQDSSSTASSLADFCPGAAAPGQDKLCCWWTSLNTFPPGSDVSTVS